ncbi:MAG TPA: hypothetical protein VF515_19305 [Candidatus Binatia bacterium]
MERGLPVALVARHRFGCDTVGMRGAGSTAEASVCNTLRGKGKVNMQRKLFALVHNIEKVAHAVAA